MKYLFCILLATAGLAACKKEDPKYCWQCTSTTDATYIYMGTETTTRIQQDTTVCGMTESEIRNFVSSKKLSFQGTYQDSITAKYNTTMDCTQQ